LLCAACADKRSQQALESGGVEPVMIQPPAEAAEAAPLPVAVAVPALPVILAPSIIFDPLTASRTQEVFTVTVQVVVKNSQGPHELSAEFVAPGAINYERRATAIDGPVDQEKMVTFVLPVAATMIDQQKMTGTWVVKLFHDGAQLSAPTFELLP